MFYCHSAVNMYSAPLSISAVYLYFQKIFSKKNRYHIHIETIYLLRKVFMGNLGYNLFYPEQKFSPIL